MIIQFSLNIKLHHRCFEMHSSAQTSPLQRNAQTFKVFQRLIMECLTQFPQLNPIQYSEWRRKREAKRRKQD